MRRPPPALTATVHGWRRTGRRVPRTGRLRHGLPVGGSESWFRSTRDARRLPPTWRRAARTARQCPAVPRPAGDPRRGAAGRGRGGTSRIPRPPDRSAESARGPRRRGVPSRPGPPTPAALGATALARPRRGLPPRRGTSSAASATSPPACRSRRRSAPDPPATSGPKAWPSRRRPRRSPAATPRPPAARRRGWSAMPPGCRTRRRLIDGAAEQFAQVPVRPPRPLAAGRPQLAASGDHSGVVRLAAPRPRGRRRGPAPARRRPRGRRLVRRVVIHDQVDRYPSSAGTAASIAPRNATNSCWRCRRWHAPITLPVATSRAANSEVVPCRT